MSPCLWFWLILVTWNQWVLISVPISVVLMAFVLRSALMDCALDVKFASILTVVNWDEFKINSTRWPLMSLLGNGLSELAVPGLTTRQSCGTQPNCDLGANTLAFVFVTKKWRCNDIIKLNLHHVMFPEERKEWDQIKEHGFFFQSRTSAVTSEWTTLVVWTSSWSSGRRSFTLPPLVACESTMHSCPWEKTET